MKPPDFEERLTQADRAVSAADQRVRHAVRTLGSDATPSLGRIGMSALAVGAVGALLLRRGRRSNSRLAKAIDYTVLLPLAANVIPRIITMVSAPPSTRSRPSTTPVEPDRAARVRARTP